jgi:hypothetical protein
VSVDPDRGARNGSPDHGGPHDAADRDAARDAGADPWADDAHVPDALRRRIRVAEPETGVY